MKVSELTGAELDYWVAKAEKHLHATLEDGKCWLGRCDVPKFTEGTRRGGGVCYKPSEDWSQGGPIIEREKITSHPHSAQEVWGAWIHPVINNPGTWTMPAAEGSTPLIAAMRVFVFSAYGEEVS